MGKEVNIHVKTTGTQQTKQDIDSVAHSTEQMGAKTHRASNWIMDGLKSLIGPLGFAAIATTVATVAGKIAKFFDELKKRCDEAVVNLENVRKGFTDLFEAMDAYDERSRRRITEETAALLKETAVSKEIGLPVINAYVRQFRGMVKTGQLTEEQYQQGLRGMLGYGERHGGPGTTDLIALMAGWGIVKPEQQGVFRRQIAAGAAASGLTDAELIEILGRGAPTAKAMGWTPAQTVEIVANLAAGEVGRKRTSLPATTLQGLLAPQETNIAKYGIPEAVAKDPQQLLVQLYQKRGQMSQQQFIDMLTDIYGTEAAAGVSKLLTVSRGDIGAAVAKAATAEAAAAEQREEATARQTLERQKAKAEAKKMEIELDVTTKEQYEKQIRDIGRSARERLRRREPVSQWLREFFATETGELEEAAQRKWMEELTPEERFAIEEQYIGYAQRYEQAWKRMTPQQRYEALTRNNVTINNYSIGQQYFPRQGESYVGPRAGPETLK